MENLAFIAHECMKDHIFKLWRKIWINDWSSQLYTQLKHLWTGFKPMTSANTGAVLYQLCMNHPAFYPVSCTSIIVSFNWKKHVRVNGRKLYRVFKFQFEETFLLLIGNAGLVLTSLHQWTDISCCKLKCLIVDNLWHILKYIKILTMLLIDKLSMQVFNIAI